jgi:RNA polymerase sigma-70 factor (ECF subfamily)
MKDQRCTNDQKADAAIVNSSKRHGEFLALIEEHKRLLFKVCWSYSAKQHDRDDLLQEIVARLWSAFPKYDR